MSTFIAPIEPEQIKALDDLTAAPTQPELKAPAPSGSSSTYLAGLLSKLDRSDIIVEQLAKESAFTNDGLEYRNQARELAFNYGPVFPMGASSGAGANTLQPFVNAFFNRERLNSGERVMPELSAPDIRATGSVFGTLSQASNWDVIARIMSGSATLDPAGAGQVAHNGSFVSAQPEGTMGLDRGSKPGGPMADVSAAINAGAGFSKRDGAGGGVVANAELSALSAQNEPIYRFAPPSGAGALAAIKAYAYSRAY